MANACEVCRSRLVTVEMLARALHSGCAVTKAKHHLDWCPSRRFFRAEAKRMWHHMEQQSKGQPEA